MILQLSQELLGLTAPAVQHAALKMQPVGVENDGAWSKTLAELLRNIECN